MILSETGIAAQALPRKVSYLRPLKTIIKIGRRSPVELRHVRVPAALRDCGAIILVSSGCS
jgi:hypothetical protein